MSSPTARLGWPGPPLNSSIVFAPLFGPESMATTVCTHRAPLSGACTGSAVNTAPAEGLPHGAALLASTWPLSVVTAPPAAFWKGSGMSTFCRLGHSTTAPTSTAKPIAINATTTILAANGPSGAGPAGCVWECVTRHRVDGRAGRLLAVRRQEVAQPLDRVCQVTRPGQRHDAQVIGRRPVESGALREQDLLLQQQVEDELLVVFDVVDLGIEPWERVERPLGLDAGHPGNFVQLGPRHVTLLEQASAGQHEVVD